MAPAAAPLVSATVFTIMFALGLGLPGDAPRLLRQRWPLVLRVLIGSCLLVPLAALMLLKLPLSAGLSPAARFAIGLMAVCPSAPLTLRKAGLQGGDRQLAAVLQTGAALAAIVSIPLLADLYRYSFGLSGWNIGPAEVALQVGQVQMLPLLAGLTLRRWQPQLVGRIRPCLDRLADGLLLLLIVLVLIKTAPLLLPFVERELLALLAMGVMVLLALGIGALMAGPQAEDRITVPLVTSMRNPGLALLLASTYAPEMPSVKIGVLVYLLVTVLLSLPFLRLQQRQSSTGSPVPPPR